MAKEATRPRPMPGVYEEPFWAHVRDRRLSLQCCNSCGHLRYPPGPVCPRCLSEDYDWTPVKGTGRLVSWVTFHRQYFPALPTPYLVAAVELDEGPILLANLLDADAANLRAGLPVRVDYQDVSDAGGDLTLFQWRLTGKS